MVSVDGAVAARPPSDPREGGRGGVGGRLRAWWNAALGAIGAVVGLIPHVLHHIGLLAGTALIAGTGGTVVFGVIGLVASLPLLLRLKKRFGSWWAPVIGLAVFAVMFAVSAFVIGPLISGETSGSTSDPVQPVPSGDPHGHND